MAQEAGPEASVASTSPTPNWWDFHASSPLPSWNNMNPWQFQNPTSSSCEEGGIAISTPTPSFTKVFNHSGLSSDSSTTDLAAEPSDQNHTWSQVLLRVGSTSGNLHNSRDDAENILQALSSKTLTADQMFQPAACDDNNLKKIDSSSWEFTDSTSYNNSLEKQLDRYNGSLLEPGKFTNTSDLVSSSWSISQPDQPQMDPQIKYEIPASYSSNRIVGDRIHSVFQPCAHGHGIIKGKNYQQQDLGASDQPSFLKEFSGIEHQISLNNSLTGVNKCYGGTSLDVPWYKTRNFSDLISFNSCLNKPMMEFRASRPADSDHSYNKRQSHDTSSSTRGSGKATGGSGEGKRKRTEDKSETQLKKSKHESSTVVSSLKVSKAKLGDKITALQQIVSPFGKTDTASVLLEAINYINVLHEQVQLLSDPYMKSGVNKDHNSWGCLERNEKREAKADLKTRGLCLIPISCTPQVYRENTGPDYWTPTYRGSLYG